MWSYSPTQLQLYLACPRKYFFQYALGLKPPKSKSQEEGTRIDNVITRAFESKAPPTDPRALAGIAEYARIEAARGASLEARLLASLDPSATDRTSPEYMLGLSDDLLVQHHIQIPIDDQKCMKGIIDLADIRDPLHPIVTDWKTTSDPKYAKVDYELVSDVQMNVYGWWALKECQNAESVVVRHVTMPTKGRARAIPAEAELPRTDVQSRWSGYLTVLDEMDVVRQKGSAVEVDDLGMRNGECQRYRGCPHLGRCTQMIFRPEMGRKTENESMGLDPKARLAALEAKGAGRAPSNGGTQGTATASLPRKETKMEELRRVRAEKAAAEAAKAAQAPESEETLTEEEQAELEQLRAEQEGAYTQQMTEEFTEAQFEEPEPTTQKPSAQNAKILALKEQGAQIARQVQERRERVEAVRGVKPESVEEPASETRIRVLYLDCAPVATVSRIGLTHELLETWAAPAIEAVRQKTGIGWQFHDYKKGTGTLCDEVQVLDAPDSLVVDTTTYLGKTLLEVLIPRADLVVKGVK